MRAQRTHDQEIARPRFDPAAKEVDPIADVQGSADYRREMVEVWVARAHRELRQRAAA